MISDLTSPLSQTIKSVSGTIEDAALLISKGEQLVLDNEHTKKFELDMNEWMKQNNYPFNVTVEMKEGYSIYRKK